MRAAALWLLLIVSNLTISAVAAETPIDVSKIIKKSDAEAALGEPVKDPTPLNLNSQDGYYSKCNYYSTKSIRSLVLRVRQAAEGTIDPQQEFEQVAARCGSMKPGEGMGGTAGMVNGTSQNGWPSQVIFPYGAPARSFT